MVSTMTTSRSYHFCNPNNCNDKRSSSKRRMTQPRSLPLVLAVLMTLSAILHPTSAFSLSSNSNNLNHKCFGSAGSGLFQPEHRTTRIPSFNVLMAVSSSDSIDTSSSSPDDNDDDGTRMRDSIRKLTGISLTALRATMRAATGISSTAICASAFAIYATALAASGVWIRNVMKTMLAPFPASVRFFLQFFLVLYYAPLYIIRNLTGPTRKNARKKREEFLEGWNDAVKAAEDKSISWPLDLGGNNDGFIDADFEKVEDSP
jgi:hypothetical protein